MKYRISVKARKDLVEIWEYSKDKWSVNQANEYFQSIVSKFDEICQMPKSGKSFEDLRKGYRGLNVKSHIIFYKLRDENMIEIVRVLHQRMDYTNKLL